MVEVSFASQHIGAFEQLSRDRNPLHVDAEYSRSTQFGRPVVFGMCAVLRALAVWAEGRSLRLLKIKGRFAHPILSDVTYRLNIREEGRQVKIDFSYSDTVHTAISFEWIPLDKQMGLSKRNGMSDLKLRVIANDQSVADSISSWQKREFPYSVDRAALIGSLGALGLQPDQIPLEQLNALVGSSYLVGMEIPGRQALYSGFEFEFEDENSETSSEFQFRNVLAQHDSRFNRVHLSGIGSGLRSFTLSAFERPRPVRYSVDEIRNAIGGTDETRFRGKAAFVSGGSRGFGHVLVKGLALMGATVFANYRSSARDMTAIVAELERWNGRVFPVQADLTSAADCEQMRETLLERTKTIDLLVCNAFPVIPAKSFLEQTISDFMEFLNAGVVATLQPLRALLPVMSQRALVVLISSSFVEEPEPRFSHYVASKSALEGLFCSLAREFPAQDFLVVRPPRMLTDQTNVAFDLSRPHSPVAIASKLFRAIGKRGSNLEKNFSVLNLSEETA